MLIIVLFHVDLPPLGGFVALDAFFVISGYVIGGLLIREKLERGRVDFGNFYLRRVRRLLPALALMLVVTAILSAVFESPLTSQRTTGRVGAYASVSLANLALYRTDSGYFAERSETILLRHTWSLSVEEQFYLVFPLVVALLLWGSHRHRMRTLLAGIVAIAAVSFSALVVMAYATDLPLLHRPQSAAYYLPITRVWEMAAGAAVAIWHVSRPPLSPKQAMWVGTSSGVALLTTVVAFSPTQHASSPALILPVGATALLLAACRTPGPVGRVLSWSPMCWVGDRSYGWYLWHWPLIVLARQWWPDSLLPLLLAAAAGLVVSTLTYRVVEQRFRYPSRHQSHRQQNWAGLRLGAACVIASVAATGSLAWAAHSHWGSPTVRTMAAQLLPLPPVPDRTGCPMAEVILTGDVAACTVGSGSGSPIYLVGDSNAGHYAAGLAAAGDLLDRPVVLLWRPGCSFADVSVIRDDYDAVACDLHNSLVADWLSGVPRTTVVLANAGEFIEASGVSMRDLRTGFTARTPTVKARAWQDGLARSLQSLTESHDVLVLRMLAHPGGIDDQGFNEWHPRTCGLLEILATSQACAISVPLSDEDVRQGPALEAEAAAVRSSSSRYVDLRETVCPGGLCRTRRGDTWVYRDGMHITEKFSAGLAPVLARALTGSD